MLIQFKVANYRSFDAEQTFSLVAGRETGRAHNLVPCRDFSLVKTAAIYGANASGKSNLIKAISLMREFVVQSATKMNLGDRIPVSAFRLNPQSRSQPSRFEITLLLNDVTYVYGFSATTSRVHDEWLDVRRPGGRLTPWLRRNFDPQTEQTAWEVKGPLKPEAELLRARTRDNGLALSRGAELNVESLAPLFDWFREKLQTLDMSSPDIVAAETARRVGTDKEFQARLLKWVRDADFGISNIHAAELPILKPERMAEMVRLFWEPFAKATGQEQSLDWQIHTFHREVSSGEEIRFSLNDDESNGTRRFVALAAPVLGALTEGCQLVIDELDCSMHPNLTRKIIQMFHSPELNTRGAQLTFATHDSSIMDATLFRRDQVWLAEKRPDGSTDLFSLFDINKAERPRKAEALEKNYLAGRYGGVPKFGPTFEDLEVP